MDYMEQMSKEGKPYNKQEQLLQGLNLALLSLMNARNNQEAYDQAFQIIGDCTNCDGIFLSEKQFLNNKKIAIEQVFGLHRVDGNWEPIADGAFASPNIIEETLPKTTPSASSDQLNSFEQTTLDQFKTSIRISILLDGIHWGYLVLANHQENHHWNNVEKEVLRSFAFAVGNYLSRKRSEEALRDQRDYFKRILDLVPNLIYAKDENRNFTMVNKAVSEAFGQTAEQMIGHNEQDFHSDPEQLKRFDEWEKTVLEGGKELVRYFDLAVAGGQQLFVQSTKKPIIGSDGSVEGILGVITDLSYQKEVEQRILEQKHLSESITHTIPDPLIILDIQNFAVTYTNISDSFLDYQLDEIDNKIEFFRSKIHPEDYPQAISKLFREATQLKEDKILEAELRIMNKEGEWIWFNQRLRVFRKNEKGYATSFLLVLQNIHKAKNSRQKLAESEKRYRNFIKYSSDGIYFINYRKPISIHSNIEEQVRLHYEEAYIEECNLAIAQMYGFQNTSELIGKKVQDLHEGEHSELNQNSMHVFVKNNYRIKDIETIEKDLEGNWKHFLNQAVGIIHDDHLVGIWGTQQDITAKKLADQALKESQERLDMVIEGASLGTWDWDIQSGDTAYNKYWTEMLGFQLNEVGPKVESFLSLLHPDDAANIWATIQHHIINKTPYFEAEFRMKTKDGKFKWIYDRGRVLVWDENGIPLRASGTHMDITERKNNEIKLRESEEFFRNLFEESPLAIAFVNMEGQIFRVNKQFCQMLGFKEEEILGKDLTTFHYDEEDLFQILAEEGIASDNQQEIRFEKGFRHKDGNQVWTSVAMGFVKDQDEDFRHIICMAEDITEKINAQSGLVERDALNMAILRALPDLKFRMRIDGTFLSYYATDYEESDLFAPKEAFLNKNIKDVLPSYVSSAAIHNAKLAIESREVKTFEYLIPNPNQGGMEYFEARISSINEIEVIVVVRNITALKKAQLSLQENIKELDVKNKQLQEYIDSNMQLENFAYIASHDLREPVRTMRSFAQLLQKKYGESLDKSGNNYIKFIVDSSNHMNQLIQDLLTYSRVNTEEHELTSIHINEILEQTLAGIQEFVKEKNATIEIKGEMPVLNANKTKMKQLFQNLIFNAIKFHKPDLAPVVQISVEDMHTHWQFSIKDNGIGIAPEFKEKIFLLFKKLHSRKEYHGTGLGLAICKRVVEQYKGEIWLDSTPGEGSTFYFTLVKNLKKSLPG